MKNFDQSPSEMKTFYYTFDGIGYPIPIPIYNEVRNYFSDKSDIIAESLSQYYLCFLKSSTQRRYLDHLISAIWEKSTNIDDQARIAISLVQRIPYDSEKAKINIHHYLKVKTRYPYEVIADNKGICGEKSLLLAFLLRQIGFGVALFLYEKEKHMAVGIKSPEEFSLFNSGYAFIETTGVSIATDNQLRYKSLQSYGIDGRKLKSYPQIIPLADGQQFNSIYNEFLDAREWNMINEKYPQDEGFYRKRWLNLVQKYGII